MSLDSFKPSSPAYRAGWPAWAEGCCCGKPKAKVKQDSDTPHTPVPSLPSMNYFKKVTGGGLLKDGWVARVILKFLWAICSLHLNILCPGLHHQSREDHFTEKAGLYHHFFSPQGHQMRSDPFTHFSRPLYLSNTQHLPDLLGILHSPVLTHQGTPSRPFSQQVGATEGSCCHRQGRFWFGL